MVIDKRYMEMHPHCMENRILHDYGETQLIEMAGYILPDGRMLNFSKENNQRDYDHRVVEDYFKDRQGTDAMFAFMRRGSVRVCASSGYGYPAEYNFEYIDELTPEQERTIGSVCQDLYFSEGRFRLQKSDSNGEQVTCYDDWWDYLEKENV